MTRRQVIPGTVQELPETVQEIPELQETVIPEIQATELQEAEIHREQATEAILRELPEGTAMWMSQAADGLDWYHREEPRNRGVCNHRHMSLFFDIQVILRISCISKSSGGYTRMFGKCVSRADHGHRTFR